LPTTSNWLICECGDLALEISFSLYYLSAFKNSAMEGNVLVCQDALLDSCACTVGTLKRNVTHLYCYSAKTSSTTAVSIAVGVTVGCLVIIALAYFGVYYAFRRQRHHYTAIPSK